MKKSRAEAISEETLRFPGGSGSQVSRQSAHKGGKIVKPTYRPPLPPRKYFWYSFLLEAESTSGSQWGRKDYVNRYRETKPRPSGLHRDASNCATACRPMIKITTVPLLTEVLQNTDNFLYQTNAYQLLKDLLHAVSCFTPKP